MPLDVAANEEVRAVFRSGVDFWQLRLHKQHSREMKRRLHTLALVQQRLGRTGTGRDMVTLPKEMWWSMFGFLRGADFALQDPQ